MKSFPHGCLFILAAIGVCAPGWAGNPRGYPIAGVPIANQTLDEGFWSAWFKRNREITIPHLFRMLRRAGGPADGLREGLGMSDETVYKTIEAASHVLAWGDDADLARELENLVELVAAALEEGDYLHVARRTDGRRGEDGKGPWSDLDLELYLSGHLYEAAVAHFQATGRRQLLDTAIESANLVHRTFGPGQRIDAGGRPEIEPALVRLYEATGDERYRELSRFFVETRGTGRGGRAPRGPFSQDHAPIADQVEAVGQAARAACFYSGVADLEALTGRSDYAAALDRLWNNVVTKKLYLTGGIGSQNGQGTFGPDYDLPNRGAHAEICAAVSFSMWNWRMFRLHGAAKYIDVLERTLYNNFLAGISLSGDRFFRACPLESDGRFKFNRGWEPGNRAGSDVGAEATRKEWFAVACCPPNWSRWLPQIPGFAYATGSNSIYISLFLAGQARVPLAGQTVLVRQRTGYPWDGHLHFTLHPEKALAFSLRIRIPGWAVGRPVPSDLYTYRTAGPAELITFLARVNDESVPVALEKGFACIDRTWVAGDTLTLNLPMPIRRVAAHPMVNGNRAIIALERGPIVFCAEGIDHDGRVLDLVLPDQARLKAEFRPELLGGLTVLTGTALRNGSPIPFRALPYYAWSNRGAGDMAVWLRTTGP